MELDYEDQRSLMEYGWIETHRQRQDQHEHEVAINELHGEWRKYVAEKWTGCVVFVACLGFVAAVAAIYHG